MNEYLLMLANSLCFVGIMSFVITTIFFTLGKFVEKQIVINNIDYLITDTMGSFPSIIKPELKQSIKDSINSSYQNIKINTDDTISKMNSSLIKKAYIFSTMLLVICLLGSFSLSKMININFSMILLQSILLVVGVAIVEIVFMLAVSMNYIIADPNQPKKYLMNKLMV